MNFKSYTGNFSVRSKYRVALMLLLFLSNSIYAQHGNDSNGGKKNIGLIYPLSSNGSGAARDTNNFSLNLIAGLSASETGLSIAGFSNVIQHHASGVQVAGFSNHLGGLSKGTLIAGFINTYKGGSGLAVAGFSNISKNNSSGQIAGFLNHTGDLSGLQVAGFLNIAKNSKGTQVGFINIADTAGTQIGLINIAKNAWKSFGLSVDENQTVILSFRSGGKAIYGIIGIGYNLDNKRSKYAYEAGLGAHLLKLKSFRLNAEVVSGGLESFKNKEDYAKYTFRLMPAIRINRNIELFGGPALNFIDTDTEEGRGMTSKYISSWSRRDGQQLYGFYMGYTAGVQVFF